MTRADLLTTARKLLGLPYIFGSKGPTSFDCSGFVTYLMKQVGGPDWRATHGSAGLFEACPRIQEAEDWLEDITAGAPHWPCPGVQPGDLAFYGPKGRVDHVMMLADSDGRVIGASGGNSGTLTPKPGASVHYKDTVDYRPDFLGFRQFPVAMEE